MRKFTPDEIEHIQSSFRDAKHPGKQITILAQCYSVDKIVIKKLLGLDEPPVPPLLPAPQTPRPNCKYSAEFVAGVVQDVLENGMTNTGAAKKHGVSIPTVCKWVRDEKSLRAGDEEKHKPQKPSANEAFEKAIAEMEHPGAPQADAPIQLPTPTAPVYLVYTKAGIFSGWQKATEETFATVELASQWIVGTVLESSATLRDMKIFQEYPILPVVGMGAATLERR